MEKIGLVKRESHIWDARVSYVVIAPGGKNKLTEAIERAELFIWDLIHPSESAEIEKANEIISKLSKRIG